MRARIRVAEYDMEFAGDPALWNELLRPIFGGPEAGLDTSLESGDHVAAGSLGESSGDPEQEASGAPDRAPSGPAAPATRPRRPAPITAEQAFVELAAAGGRRAEKDAVLLAVWVLGDGTRDVPFADVARTVHDHDAFRDVRVKPRMLKHVNRSRMLDIGATRETVRLTEKGCRYVRSLME
jgi:hypothetical protein